MTLLQHELTDFKVNAFQNNEFHEVTKVDVLGHWSLFFFYPADFTFVCPTELEDLARNYAKFKEIGCEVYSVSCDTHFVHKACMTPMKRSPRFNIRCLPTRPLYWPRISTPTTKSMAWLNAVTSS